MYNVLEYQNSGVWDPGSRQVLFLGGPHSGQGKFLVYDEASNTWRQEADPPPETLLLTHTYDHNTINPGTGELYFRPYLRPQIWKYKIAAKEWSKLTTIPQQEYNCCGAIEYFSDRDGILFVGKNEAAFYDLRKGSWSTSRTAIKTGPYHSTAEYSPPAKVVIFGGGSTVNTVYRMDASGGVAQMGDSPYPLDSGGHAIFTADPTSPRFLLFGENGTFYVYDPMADRWELQKERPPFFDVGPYGPVSCSIAIPISTHGVVMFVTYSASRPTVFLYKPSRSPAPR
jgi:hypothetical protein